MLQKRNVVIAFMLVCCSNVSGYKNPLKSRKKTNIQHISEKNVENLTPMEWLHKFANLKDLQTFNKNSEMLAQLIFFGDYPSGWFTDEISLKTRAKDAAGMYRRYNSVLHQKDEDTVGWFRMINNTRTHIEYARPLKEEQDKIREARRAYEKEKEIKKKLKETIPYKSKYSPREAYKNLKELAQSHFKQEFRWSHDRDPGASLQIQSSKIIQQSTKGYQFVSNKSSYYTNFTRPLEDMKQYTVDFFKLVKEFLASKQNFPQVYLEMQTTPENIKDAEKRSQIIQKLEHELSREDIEHIHGVTSDYEKKIDDLVQNIMSAKNAIFRALEELPDDQASHSMLLGIYKSQLIAINLLKAVERIQFGIHNEAYLIGLINDEIKAKEPPKQLKSWDFVSYLEYIDPLQWLEQVWGGIVQALS